MNSRILLNAHVLAVLIIGVSSSTYASELSLRFVGSQALDDNSAGTCFVCGPVQVEVLWTQTIEEASNGLGGVTFSLTAVSENSAPGLQGELVGNIHLDVSNFSTTLPNWNVSSAPAFIGAPGNFSIVPSALSESLTTPGTTVIGSFEIVLNTPAVAPAHEFYFRRSLADFTPDISMGTGASYTFSSSDPDGYQGFYGIRNGYAGNVGGLGALPMTVYDLVPEPTTLVLLASGALAICRRSIKRC